MTDFETSLKSVEWATGAFRAHTRDAEDGLHLPGWQDAEWRALFSATTAHAIAAGEPLIRRGDRGRNLYLVVEGKLEISLPSIDGLSLGRVGKVVAGSVLGEQAFFDAEPRSASAWAITPCDLRSLDLDQYAAFERAHPGLARDLLFALGRILAIRLRQTTARLAP